MRKMGIAAPGPRPNTTRPASGHRIYPCLLRNLTIDRPKQARRTDITYLPIGRGFLYLVAIIDWASRAVLAWRLSNTMDVSFCVAALEEALERYGTREIFNTDQGSQGGFRRSLMLPPKRCITSSGSMILSALPMAQNGRRPLRWC